MRIEIIIFFILFVLFFSYIFRDIKQLHKKILYTNVMLESVRILQKYNETKIGLEKYLILNKFIKCKLNIIDILKSATSFDEIQLIRAKKNEKLNDEEIEQLLLEVKEAPEEIKNIFFRLLQLNNIIFKNSRVYLTNRIYIKGNVYYWFLSKLTLFQKIKNKNINELSIIEKLKTV